jgi:hypothetical protein
MSDVFLLLVSCASVKKEKERESNRKEKGRKEKVDQFSIFYDFL